MTRQLMERGGVDWNVPPCRATGAGVLAAVSRVHGQAVCRVGRFRCDGCAAVAACSFVISVTEMGHF
jgi:hypothetical protein